MKASDIRRIAIGAAAGLLVLVALAWVAVRAGDAGRPPAPAYWPTGEWRQSTPEEQGFDSARLAEGLRAIRGKGIRIHSLTLIRHGRVLLQKTRDGQGVAAVALHTDLEGLQPDGCQPGVVRAGAAAK